MILKEYKFSPELQEKLVAEIFEKLTRAQILATPGVYEIISEEWNNDILEHFMENHVQDMWDEIYCKACHAKWRATERDNVFEFCPDCMASKSYLDGFFWANYKMDVRETEGGLYHIYLNQEEMYMLDDDPYADNAFVKRYLITKNIGIVGKEVHIHTLPDKLQHYIINLLKPE